MYIVMLMNSSGDDEYCMYGNHMTGFTTTRDILATDMETCIYIRIPHICIRMCGLSCMC